MKAIGSFFGAFFILMLVFSMLFLLVYTPSRVMGFPYVLRLDPTEQTVTFMGEDYYFDFSIFNRLKNTASEIFSLNEYLIPKGMFG